MNIGGYWNNDIPTSTTAADILQRQSINSLLGNAGHASPQEGDTISSITELFGLNKPRGTMFSNYGSLPPELQHYDSSLPPELQHYGSAAKVINKSSYRQQDVSPSPQKAHHSGWGDTSLSSPVTPPHYGRSEYDLRQERSESSRYKRNMRASSYSESNSSASPATPLGLYGSPTSPLEASFGARNLLDLILNEPQLFKNPVSCLADYTALDRAARFHRSGASLYDATCTWSGVLPKRVGKVTGYSPKVFLGGVPWDISEESLVATFRHIGPIRVEWPGKEKQALQPKGYVYIIFENEKQVKHLLSLCTPPYFEEKSDADSLYYKISSKRMKSKEVQVIPWILNDTNYVRSTSQKLDPSKTVFVGALHGMLNAEGLAKIMNDLFEGVVYAGIDTDKWKYPIGSGRVTFSNHRSFIKAVSAAFIDIKTAKFSKKVQVDPYLEDSLCSLCGVQQGPYFCREMVCFRYFCRTCWQMNHLNMAWHKPLMRNSKSPIIGMSSPNSRAN